MTYEAIRFLDAVIVLVALVYAISKYQRGEVDRAIFWMLVVIAGVIPPK